MADTYVLGVDVGTSRVSASLARLAHDGSAVASRVPLGRRAENIPSTVFVTPEGDLLFGEAAERRGIAEPERLIREAKRSVGDAIPLVVGGHQFPAEQVFARTIAHVVETVTEREGVAPASITVTRPAAWGLHRTALVRDSLAELGLSDVDIIADTEAAVKNYEATHKLAAGQAVVVYDLGANAFQAAVLRKGEAGGYEQLGSPVRVAELGGASFDDAVFRHVLVSAGLTEVDPTNDDVRVALSQLREECVEAKEVLSFDSDVTVPAFIPPSQSSVRLTRSEFEDMIEESLDQTVDAVESAVENAGLGMDHIAALLLIGGSSRIPRVTQKLSEVFDLPIAIDSDPKSSTAMGAARAALVHLGDLTVTPGDQAALSETPSPSSTTDIADLSTTKQLTPVAAESAAEIVPRSRWKSTLTMTALLVTVAVIVAASLNGGLFSVASEWWQSNHSSPVETYEEFDSSEEDEDADLSDDLSDDPEPEPSSVTDSTPPNKPSARTAVAQPKRGGILGGVASLFQRSTPARTQPAPVSRPTTSKPSTTKPSSSKPTSSTPKPSSKPTSSTPKPSSTPTSSTPKPSSTPTSSTPTPTPPKPTSPSPSQSSTSSPPKPTPKSDSGSE